MNKHGPAPRDECENNGREHDVNAQVAGALDALAARPQRDDGGRFVRGVVKTGKGSTQLWAALEPAKRDLVDRVRRDQALDEDSPETLAGLVDAYAEARLLRTSLFMRMVDLGGPVTTRGRTRALYGAYLSALDRETRLAQTLGLERRQRKTQSLAEILDGR